MTLKEHCSVFLPHFKLSNELQKDSLFDYCISNEIIRKYLPDNCKAEFLQRDLLISVSFI